MKQMLFRVLNESRFGRQILKGYDYLRCRLIPEKTFINKQFRKALEYDLCIENPETFNEKIQWLKLYDRTELHTLCADKFAVRDLIKTKLGETYLTTLLLQTKKPYDISKENLPDLPVIIKLNHNSGGTYIVRDKNNVNWKDLRKLLATGLKSNFYYQTKEWQYKNISPCIIVEKLLLDKNGHIPIDFKFHCFNGKVAFIQVDIDRQTDHKRNLYDPEWNFIDCHWVYKNGATIEKPECLEEMRSVSEILASPFVYVRIDLYCIDGNIFFGEFTFHPESGLGPFTPSKWDKIFGDMLLITNR